MSMPQEMDYTTLKWVKDEIAESLKQTRQALEAYVENPDDKTQIRFCTTYLHQIYGTLQMVEIYGGALLAEEMESLTQAILDDHVSQKDDAYDVLMRAILQLPSYLEHIEQGNLDQPVILLPLLNDLRASRGEPLLSDNAFFAPNLAVSPPVEAEEKQLKKPAVDKQKYIKKLRTAYQASLVGIYRNKNVKANLKKITTVLRELHHLSENENASRLWWVASAVIEAIYDEGIEAHNSVKLLIGQIDREIKRVVASGKKALQEDPPADLVKNLLYYVATAKSSGQRVSQIKEAFNLDQILPGSSDVNEAFDNLRGSSADLLKSVSTVIKEDLLQVKDQLDIFVRGNDKNPEQLRPLADQLGRISDTLVMLGFGDLRKIIHDQFNNVNELIGQAAEPSEMNLMEIASALLFVESSLDGIEASQISSPDTVTSGEDETETLLPSGEQKHLSRLVISEAAEVLAKVKENFDTFAKDTNNLQLLSGVPEHLNQVKGVLAILAFDQASVLLQSTIEYIRDEILRKKNKPNQPALDAVADVITSIEYYLEAVADSKQNPESILAVAQNSVKKLGYTVDEAVAEPIEKAEGIAAVKQPIDDEFSDLALGSLEDELTSAELNLVDQPTLQISGFDPDSDFNLDSGINELRLETGHEQEEPTTPELENLATGSEQDSPQAVEPIEDDIDEEILEIFIEEADEVLVTISEKFQEWKSDNSNADALDVLRRSYHTIKGSGRLAGAVIIGEMAWSIEDMLNRVIDGKITASVEMYELLGQTEEMLAALIKVLKGETNESFDIQPICTRANEIASDEVKQQAEETPEEEPIELTEPSLEAAVELLDNAEADLAALPTQETSLIDIFRKETAVHLDSIQTYISQFDASAPQHVDDNLMRALHTLHGSARMAKVSEIAQISEPLDRFFAVLRDTRQPVDQGAIEILAHAAGLITEMRENFDQEDKQLPDPGDFHQRIASLHETAEANSLSAIEETDSELVGIFVEEAGEILNEIGATLGKRDKLGDVDTMDALQRSLHTLKGGARMAGIKSIAELCYRLENLFSSAVSKGHALDYDLIALNNDYQNWMESALSSVQANTDITSNAELLERIEQYEQTLGPAHKDAAEPSTTDSEEMIELDIGDLPLQSEPSIDSDQAEENELLDIFLAEASEIQLIFGKDLEDWRSDIQNKEPISALQRSLHTLKGGARMAEADDISNLAHAIESLLEDIYEQRIQPANAHIEIVQAGQDWLTHALEQMRNNQTVDPATQLLADVDNLSSKEPVVALDPIEKLEEPVEEAEVQEEPVAEILQAEPTTTDEKDEEPAVEIETVEIETVEIEQVAIPDFNDAINDTSQSALNEQSTDDDDEFDAELMAVFLEEAEEIQENTDKLLHQWVTDVQNRQYIAELQRDLHTLKGGARMANIIAIGDLSHAIESLLEAVTNDLLEPTADFPRIIQVGHDWITEAVAELKNNRPIKGNAKDLIQQLESLAANKPLQAGVAIDSPESPAEEKQKPAKPVELVDVPLEGATKLTQVSQQIKQTSPRSRDEQIRIRADLIDNLINHAGEISIYNSRIDQQFNDWHFNLSELNQTVQRLQGQLRKFEIETEAQIMYRLSDEGESQQRDDFDPLELDRFSYMQQLSRGLVESLNDLTSIQTLLEANSSEADVLLLQQSRINSDLQEGLMRTRLTPFSSILARLRRIVRQTCQETNKEAELNVYGAEGEMDRTQLNRIVPALEHILRNAIGHGIELPNKRKKANKSTGGKIDIHFTREGSEVVLQIRDDGAGINLKSLRKKAIEKGLLEKRAEISDGELTEFILHSGFSTADKVTQISGRGIGMDVVNNEIKQLNGTLFIETVEGQGTTFTVRLPLTILINNALLVHVDDSIYAIQLSNIEHVVRLTGDEFKSYIESDEQLYDYGGHQYQHINLAHVLHGTKPEPPNKKQRYPIILGRSGEHRVALQFDQLLGRQEIVVKSMGPQLSTVNNISGATILPDGNVALILDIGTLIRSNLALQQRIADGEVSYADQAKEAADEIKAIRVLIVDDSITVRKVTERVLKRHNFETYTAKDGVDALTQLLDGDNIPDVMLLDVEMPRMDGYELAATMKNEPLLKDIPIIMITSRTGEKHRERAMSVGVNMYMGKPYQETDLLENIQKLTKKQ